MMKAARKALTVLAALAAIGTGDGNEARYESQKVSAEVTALEVEA